MHKSKLAGFIIDCRTDDLQGAAGFWGAALGMEVRQLPPDQAGKYVELVDRQSGLHVEVQAVTHPSRVHLDIETDDIEAEVARLTALGATEVERIQTWVVMRDPAGLLFCVVEPMFGELGDDAHVWP
jgi:catechol 2,3-dioxygenase-like lactoylglutathione lyase family enzyme